MLGRRWARRTAMLMLVLLVGAAALWRLAPHDTVSAATCEKIAKGMPIRDVEKLIGHRADCSLAPPSGVVGKSSGFSPGQLMWSGSHGFIVVAYGWEETVLDARFDARIAVQPSLIDRIRGLLGR
jgi:hypothetical protein